ncbi:CobQ/CobB/MinD/ParA nucleotide binding domain protein [Leptospira interrogans serovar Australis str. 200703203]|uniref:CobQ/CobB/MinD/ParA nucleotide binding domain protein n=1 Tax=Leptospira interrogans serovar Australis str. 200703203 TaxID=1085541 RepID=N1UD53_LEPIR|nr:CobQ/CobB/MinD/ParA nucleotide binding domain protein [Leptospira interrogans serovar Australis str. 200703203]
MQIVTLANLKGGVSKTTTSINVSLQLSQRKRRVLCMDLDLNNNQTDFFLRGVREDELDERNIYHALLEQKEIGACIYETRFPGIDILPATLSLGKLTEELGSDPEVLSSFAKKLRELEYDFVIIDTPVYLSLELRFALWVADVVLYPIRPSRWNFQGTKTLLEEIEKMYMEFQEAGWKETKPCTLLVPSIVTKRKKDAERIAKLRQKYEVSKTVIWKLSAIETATEMGRALKENTKGYELFRDLTEELLDLVCKQTETKREVRR